MLRKPVAAIKPGVAARPRPDREATTSAPFLSRGRRVARPLPLRAARIASCWNRVRGRTFESPPVVVSSEEFSQSTPASAGRGGGPSRWTRRPPPLAGTNARKEPTRAARSWWVPLLFDNSVVGHTRIHVVDGARGPRASCSGDEVGFTLHPRAIDRDASCDGLHVQGEWHTPQHSFTAASTRVEAAEMNDTNPLGSGSHRDRDRGPRRETPGSKPRGPQQPADRFHAFPRRGGPIGVVKLLRARGECLGVIRNSSVEGCDMSGGAAQRASSPEFSRKTQGTETSQYLEEKKSTETPLVAASERGLAQTEWVTIRGRGTGDLE